MGQRLGRQSNNSLSSLEVFEQQQQQQNNNDPYVSDSLITNNYASEQQQHILTRSGDGDNNGHLYPTSAVIIKIQLLKMESNNLNGNGEIVGQLIVDQSLASAVEQLTFSSSPTITTDVTPTPTPTNVDYLPMSAVPTIGNNNTVAIVPAVEHHHHHQQHIQQQHHPSNNLNRNNNLSRSVMSSTTTNCSESDSTISSSNSNCSSNNNSTATTLNIVCDNNKLVNNLSMPQQQQNQRNINMTSSEPNKEIYTMMYAANSNGGSTSQANGQDEELALVGGDSRNSCNHCSRRRTLAALARRSRVCKLCHESLDDATPTSGKAGKEKATKDKDGGKSKKGNWGIKFNCAKLRGSSSNSSSNKATPTPVVVPVSPVPNASSDCNASPCSAVPNGIGYTNVPIAPDTVRTFDSCVCTGYRKVDDSESERSESEYDVRVPQHATKTTTTSVSLFSTTTTTGPSGTTSRTSTFLLPDHTTTTTIPTNIAAGPASIAPLTTTSTTTTLLHANGQLIQRIERTTAALYGNNPTVGTNSVILVSMNHHNPPMIDIAKFNAEEFPIEDCDEQARIQRALEIAEGVEPPPGFTPSPTATTVLIPSTACGPQLGYNNKAGSTTTTQWSSVYSPDAIQEFMNLNMATGNQGTRAHSQVDYIHCLVPDLQKITGCCFYWGKMDRYEAEKLLEGKPEGTFLLRDSAQEDFLFSVSFRKYGRSLHARIEQFNHKFSFDSHDPGVYTASTVTGLLAHYKDPNCVMFFEPMLTLPLNRNFCFSLQQLCRATIVSHITYDGINELCLPQRLRNYLQEYHYKQRLRVKRLDDGGIYAKTS